jgi:rod shape determining protein RodA
MIGRETLSERLRDHFDWPILISATLIAICGVVNLYSATSVYTGARAELYISQIQWLAIGGILGGVLLAIDYRQIERFAYVIYAFGVFNLILVAVLGKDVRGAARSIPIGSFQYTPSEFMKVFMVIALAKYLHDDPRNEGRTLKDLLVPAVLAGVPAVLILKQPDLGTASILMLIFFTIAAVTRIHWHSVVLFVTTAVPTVILYFEYQAHSYQQKRLTAFWNPEADIKGIGYHAHHARVAIGDGGLLGTGFGHGTQNKYGFIPDQYTDFPFPVYAEEWGFAGCVLLIGLYCFLVIWSIYVASQAKDRFGAVLAVGCAGVIFWHAVINMGMTAGVVPVVGVPLPLFSYGGSNLITMISAVALVMNVSMRRYGGVPPPERL